MDDWAERKKLFPASAGVTVVESRMVNFPTPGRMRFLRTEVLVAEEDRRRTWADSRADWPEWAQRLETMSELQHERERTLP
jgi:hypothetical protein